jgi:hypothetical protein
MFMQNPISNEQFLKNNILPVVINFYSISLENTAINT